MPIEKLVGSGKSTTIASNISSCCSSQANASALTIVTFGERSESPFRSRSSGAVENSCVMCGSSSTSVTRSTLAYLQHLAHRHAVAAAEDEHASRRAVRGERRMDQRLVIAVLVARVELQVAVEEEAHAGRGSTVTTTRW